MTLFALIALIATGSVFWTENSLAAKTEFGGAVQVARSTSLYDYKDGSRSDSLDTEVALSARFTNGQALSAKAAYSADLRNEEKGDISDVSLTYVLNQQKWGKSLLVTPLLLSSIPASKESRLLRQAKGSLGAGLKFLMNPEVLISKNLEISLSLTASRNFHEYTTAIDGSVLSQYSSNQILSLGYSLGRFSLNGVFVHKNGLTYQSNLKESFEMTEELGYTLSNSFSVALGHTNAGSVFKPNGQDSNINLVDDNNSMVYLSAALNF